MKKFILDLLKSRKFWTAVVGVIAVIIAALGRTIDEAKLTEILYTLAALFVSLAISPPSAEKWISMFKSRELWAALITLLFIFSDTFGIQLPFTAEEMLKIVMWASGLIVASGAAPTIKAIASTKIGT